MNIPSFPWSGPPREYVRLLETGQISGFVERPQAGGGQLWIAADTLGAHVIRRQGRLAVPIRIPALWRRLLRSKRYRGVMVAGASRAERAAQARLRAELARIGRHDVPVTALFGERYIEWWCTLGRSVPVSPARVAPRDGRMPERLVVILAAPRTGSSLLADLLAHAGVLPLPPRELFNRNPERLIRAGLFTRTDLIRRYGELHTGAEGLGGVKIQGLQFARMLRGYEGSEFAAFAPMLRAAKVVRLTRQDRIAQAASFVRAQRDNLWHLPGNGGMTHRVRHDAPAPSDFELRRTLRRMKREERLADFAAARFFDPGNVMHMTYEELTTDIAAAVGRVTAHLGTPIDPGALHDLTPRTRTTRDAYDDDLVARLAALAGGACR